MMQTKRLKSGVTILASGCFLALGMASSSALGAFLDWDHRAESVHQNSSVTEYSHTFEPTRVGFIDRDHSAENARHGSPQRAERMSPYTALESGFIDWDHSAASVGS